MKYKIFKNETIVTQGNRTKHHSRLQVTGKMKEKYSEKNIQKRIIDSIINSNLLSER